jgi:hypothetical protein
MPHPGCNRCAKPTISAPEPSARSDRFPEARQLEPFLVRALMFLALMERQVRRELKGEPLYGLYPEGRPSPAPTEPSLIEGLSRLCIVIVHQGGTISRRLAQPDPAQRPIIHLLKINSERLQIFKRGCGM